MKIKFLISLVVLTAAMAMTVTSCGSSPLDKAVKRALVQCLYADMHTSAGATPVMVCMQKLAVSLAQVYLGERRELELPLPGLPLDLTQV